MAPLEPTRTGNPVYHAPMPHIDIHREHGQSLEQAQDTADAIAQDLAEKFSVDYGWDGDEIHFQRSGVDGRIRVDREAIHVQARLGFLLIYLQPAIEREINRYLDEHFAG